MIRKPGQAERRAMLGIGVTHLGRAEDNDVVLTDIGVSRRHARLLIQPTGVWIEDLGSGNGTYFQGSRVSRQLLKHGDEILIDPFLLRFEIPDEEVPSDEGLTGELEDVDDDDTVRVPSVVTSASVSATGPVLPRARLITLNGQRLAPSYPIRANGLTIGRSDARDVILFDPAASRNHARLELVGNDVWLRDDSSGNGTFVNALRVREQCLRHGDRVRVGSTEFRFELLDSVVSEPPTMPPRTREVSVVRKLDRAPVVPESRSFPLFNSAAVVAVMAVAALVLMMLVGGAAALYASDFSILETSGSAQTQELASKAPALPLAQQRKFKSHFSRGDSLFEGGEYLLAAAQYYAALKIDPDSTRAERMGVTSCEYLLLDNIRATLQLQAMPDDEKQTRKAAALKLGRRAVRGRANSADAVKALEEVQVFLPDDAKVVSMLEQLKSG